jgi:hypothetical protein
MMKLSNIITHLRVNRGLPDLLFREVLGNETSKVVLVRTPNEFIDELVGQYGTTLVPFGSTYLLNKGLDAFIKRVNLPKTEVAQEWVQLSKSLALYSSLGALLMSMSQVRNLVTQWRIGDQSYAQIIGEKKESSTTEPSQRLASQRCKKAIARNLIVGGAGVVASMGIGLTCAKKNTKMPQLFKAFNQHLGLKNGDLIGMEGWKAFLFWSIPSYAGYFLAARDPYEVQELSIKYTAFLVGFFAMPFLVSPFLKKLFTQESKWFGSPENQRYLAEAFTSILALGVLPPLLNIYLTRQRIQRENKQQQIKKASTQGFHPSKPTSFYRPEPSSTDRDAMLFKMPYTDKFASNMRLAIKASAISTSGLAVDAST